MPFVAIPDTWEVALKGTFVTSGKPWAMIFHVLDPTGIGSLTPAQNIAAAFKTWWGTTCVGDLGQSINLTQIVVTDLAISTGLQLVYTTGLPIAGTGGNVSVTSQSAIVVTLRSVNRGRSFRGRKFVPGVPTGDEIAFDPTNVSAAAQTAWSSHFNALITAIQGLSGAPDLAVASKKLAISSVVTSILVRPYWGTQRRRAAAGG